MITVLLVALGAAIGAPARYLADRYIQTRHDSVFPWGTLGANGAGCLILGLLAGAGDHVPPQAAIAVGTGFCGALTTYSTFAYETVRLAETRARFLATANVIISVVGGTGAGAIGLALAQALAQAFVG